MKLDAHHLKSSNGIPNNRLPLIHYKGALDADLCTAEGCSDLFRTNGWQGIWLNGVFPYWHYHAHAHEVLGCVSGRARIGFGGDEGIIADFKKGDVVLVPAGVGHNRLSQDSGFRVVGGYPPHQDGAISESGSLSQDEALRAVASVPIPASDPVLGSAGGLIEIWQ